MIEIPLTKGYVTLVDDEDGDLAGFKWQVSRSKQTAYAIRTIWHQSGTRETARLHRIIIARMLNGSLTSKQQIDHINGDGLDNRRANLRLATPLQNARNRAIQCNNTSGVRGVSWSVPSQKWRARIMTCGVSIDLGLFDDIEGAAAARRTAEREHFGEFSTIVSRETA